MNKKQLISIIRIEVLLAKSSPERKGYIAGLEEAINIIEGFSNEPQKPVVPQFVAEIIEYYKRNNATLYDALGEKNFNKQYSEWLLNEQNAYDKVAKAWLDGYEIEKEKRYLVKVKGVCGNHETLNREKHSKKWLFSDREENTLYDTKFTRTELEQAGFGWVFDCEGVEVEEVE
ncbi:DUF1642 domain-containing protein [Streptococcus gordonii]|uniref:DUF1642 domain-containing protein n=1 Tax=Streptococcus gordonii TaxID=1302 RepID=UPI001EDEB00D|nr:DUF1642 domain-containing protein [Streptococcus gordonii]MCG4822222.1 DUF1642 domain-containing protein [Streptococcus gordonii]MCG4847766.1 DUF1642 domain-containing protein [Streptococcus gordonii]MDE8686151.1 DUF1642 domain-containing protein [Streptococcus gordonii]